MATTKKSIMAPKPSSTPMTVEDFVAAAPHQISDTGGDSGAKKEKPNKKQVPLLISETLLKELDELLLEDEFGISRSMWICKAIREKIDAQK